MKEVIIEIGARVETAGAQAPHYPVRLLEFHVPNEAPTEVPCADLTKPRRIPLTALAPESVNAMAEDLRARLNDDSKLKEYGAALCTPLLEAVPEWAAHLDAPDPCRTYLSLPPELRQAPWELLYHQKQELWLGLIGPIVRMATIDLAPRLKLEWPLRLLIVTGVPLEEKESDVLPKFEVDLIRESLRPVDRLVDLKILDAPPTLADFEQAIDAFLPHIVHFIGHGQTADGRPALRFPAWDLTTDKIKVVLNPKTRALANKKPWAPRLAFLNACRSGVAGAAEHVRSIADAFLEMGADSVMAMQADVKGTTAGQFAGTLYLRLGGGRPLDLAINEARGVVATNGVTSFVSEACVATLTVRRSPEAIFPPWSALAPNWLTLAKKTTYMEVVPYFVDHIEQRRDVMYKLWPYTDEQPQQLIVVHGPEGVGKSALAAWLLDLCIRVGHYFRYVSLRDRDGTAWLDVLRHIRGQKPIAAGDLAFDALPYDAFGWFHYQLKYWADNKQPPAPWDGTLVEDPGGALAITDTVLNAFVSFRAGLTKLGDTAPVVMVLDDFNNMEAGTFWTLWEHLFKPIGDGLVKNVRLLIVLTDTEFDTRFAVRKTLNARPELQTTYAPREMPLRPATEFVDIAEEFLLARFEGLRGDRELVRRVLVQEIQELDERLVHGKAAELRHPVGQGHRRGMSTRLTARLRELAEAEDTAAASIDDAIRELERTNPITDQFWRRVALVRFFDQVLCNAVLAKGLSDPTVRFESVTSHTRVEPVPRTPGTFRLRDTARVEILRQWQTESGSQQAFQDGMRQVYARLLEYYATVETDEIDLLISEAAVAPDLAVKRFDKLFADANKAFDLPRCHMLVRALLDCEVVQAGNVQVTLALLDEPLRKRSEERTAFLEIRGRYVEEYYQTASYLDRKPLRNILKDLLAGEKGWILNLHGRGGMGKTMFMKWLVARHCVARGLPVARVDFDHLRPSPLKDFPWLILLPMAEQLNRQLPESLFGEFLTSYQEFGAIVVPPAVLPPRFDVQGLESQLRSQSPAWIDELQERFFGKLEERSAILMLDTVEEPMLYHPEAFAAVVNMFVTRRRGSALRVVLSGRYDLIEKFPTFRAVAAAHRWQAAMPAFDANEAREYLVSRRRVDPARYPVRVMIKKAGGNPFLLSLLADLVRLEPSMTPAEVIRLQPEFEHLIRRVIDRIPNDKADVRWIVRYGAVPSRLTQAFLKEVMWEPLLRELGKEEAERRDAVSSYSDYFPRMALRSPAEVWNGLAAYASENSWLTQRGEELRFQPDVRGPMRRLLSKETDVFTELNEKAAEYFRKRAENEPAAWGVWAGEALYHLFQSRGPAAADAFHATLADARSRDLRQRQPIVDRLTTGDFVDDDGNSVTRHDGTPLVDDALLAEAHALSAYATTANAVLDANANTDWSVVRRRYSRALILESRSGKALLRPAVKAIVAAGLASGDSNPTNLLANVEAGLAASPAPEERFLLLMQLGAARQRLGHDVTGQRYAEARDIAAAAGWFDGAIVAGRALARWFTSSGEYWRALEANEQTLVYFEAAPDATGADALRYETASVYVAIGDWTKALTTLKKVAADARTGRAKLLEAEAKLGQWQLLDVEALLTIGAKGPSEALQFELGARLAAAWLDVSRAQELLRQASRTASKMGQLERVRPLLRALDVIIDGQGNWRAAATLLADATRLAQTDQTPDPHLEAQIIAARLRERALRGVRSPLPSVPSGRALLEHSYGVVEGTLVAAAQLVYGPTDEPSQRVAADVFLTLLEKVQPPQARGGLLQILKHHTALLPAGAQDRLFDLIPQPALGSPDFVGHFIETIDALRCTGDSGTCENLFFSAVDRCVKDLSGAAPLREVLLAGDRLGLAPIDDVIVATAAKKAFPHGVAAALLIEQAERRSSRGDWDALAGLIDTKVLGASLPEELEGSAFVPRLLVLRAALDARRGNLVAAQASRETAAKLFEDLGQLSRSKQLEETGPGRDRTQPWAPRALELQLTLEGSVLQGVITQLDRPPWKEERDAGPLAPSGRDRFSRSFARELAKNRDQAIEWMMSALPAELGKNTGSAFAALIAPQPCLAALPWEIALSKMGITAYRSDSRGALSGSERIRWLQLAIGTSVPDRVAVDGIPGAQTRRAVEQLLGPLPDNEWLTPEVFTEVRRRFSRGLVVLVARRGRETELRAVRGSRPTRSSPSEDAYKRLGCRVEVSFDPSHSELEREIRALEPDVIHLQATIEESQSADELYLDFRSGHDYVSLAVDTGFTTPGGLARTIGTLRSRTKPVVILDPPRPPTPDEATRQLLNRNAFASALYHERGCSGVLAIGLDNRRTGLSIDDAYLPILTRSARAVTVLEAVRSGPDALAASQAALFVEDPFLPFI